MTSFRSLCWCADVICKVATIPSIESPLICLSVIVKAQKSPRGSSSWFFFFCCDLHQEGERPTGWEKRMQEAVLVFLAKAKKNHLNLNHNETFDRTNLIRQLIAFFQKLWKCIPLRFINILRSIFHTGTCQSTVYKNQRKAIVVPDESLNSDLSSWF